MNRVVTDTHALHWHLTNNPKLVGSAHRWFLDADRGTAQIMVPGIVVVEFVYLVEKGRLAQSFLDLLLVRLRNPKSRYLVAPLDLAVAAQIAQIPRTIVPEMPDRMIAATALALNLPLITRDHQIQHASVIQTIWD